MFCWKVIAARLPASSCAFSIPAGSSSAAAAATGGEGVAVASTGRPRLPSLPARAGFLHSSSRGSDVDPQSGAPGWLRHMWQLGSICWLTGRPARCSFLSTAIALPLPGPRQRLHADSSPPRQQLLHHPGWKRQRNSRCWGRGEGMAVIVVSLHEAFIKAKNCCSPCSEL